ncbi:RNA-binding S4 domain-containing protein [Halanaerobacter jeridensis]|uniref:Ribosome-associated protein n=1 Tax=Halanaerobacter jeridensis TaxID=706427 RepID=A0A938XU22_9FIRM|nr:RNA-binding S4 domain-containing protein [Halanaerobacter jeridensis]MBM7557761.1 ribosome-associated protein [Halanaerobacter jeridensis]
MEKIKIKTETIDLGQLLKWGNLVSTGGEAKAVINEKRVKVNGEVETQRAKTLKPGDIVEFEGQKYKVVAS